MITDYSNSPYGFCLSTDTLPHDKPNGTHYKVIDTGNEYFYDEENDKWYDKDGNEVTES